MERQKASRGMSRWQKQFRQTEGEAEVRAWSKNKDLPAVILPGLELLWCWDWGWDGCDGGDHGDSGRDDDGGSNGGGDDDGGLDGGSSGSRPAEDSAMHTTIPWVLKNITISLLIYLALDSSFQVK